jgi:hypothetical protein
MGIEFRSCPVRCVLQLPLNALALEVAILLQKAQAKPGQQDYRYDRRDHEEHGKTACLAKPPVIRHLGATSGCMSTNITVRNKAAPASRGRAVACRNCRIRGARSAQAFQTQY